jgi:hypothetical protein
VALELLTLLGYVDPQAPVATYARGTLDCEADGDGIVCLWRNIDILASHIGRAVVVEGQQVNLVRHHGFWDHVVRTESCPAQSWAAGSWGYARMHPHVSGVEGQAWLAGKWRDRRLAAGWSRSWG